MKVHEFKPGQRIKAIRNDFNTPEFTGEIIEADGRYLEVKRDDGVSGGGNNGGWLCLPECPATGVPLVEVIENYKVLEDNDCLPPKHVHMAGIDREEINQDAYREFMRGL